MARLREPPRETGRAGAPTALGTGRGQTQARHEDTRGIGNMPRNTHITRATAWGARGIAKAMALATTMAMAIALALAPQCAHATESDATAPAQATQTVMQTAGAKDGATTRRADDSGSGSYMTDIDLTNIAQKDANASDDGGGSNLVQNSIGAMQQIVNTVLLPIGIVVVVARLMYIAVFPLMLNMDPFDVVDTDSFREGPQSIMRKSTRGGNGDGSKDPMIGAREYDWGAKGDWRVKLTQEQVEYILKQELIGSGKVLLMIIIIWGIINLAIWLAGTMLSYFHI